ncbi:hypothetical protein GUJ93_ZPchr0010g8119 [Zizania palustris]|uniref:Uncharacterized protein n=1 Tax=Zizania palustris TaxID=103762 RepID=A0A8J5W8Q6_ZIZPA|nr:hypothetical protein GUJ93_ZPchr0010g8119 [Zizania palustris]
MRPDSWHSVREARLGWRPGPSGQAHDAGGCGWRTRDGGSRTASARNAQGATLTDGPDRSELAEKDSGWR